ncbi:DUF1569 domain-containing protein [Thalassotalea euphylliae]|uniref:DUF1569 domain-containing protein n=1 Tax=Thalassotalea euphylliae TaxID=1655234 RepID=A0A3E0TSL6_9GAMM|nr:DUF1569 domain-containing protein [Thalassotalea euphylliae]REL27479.1 DUF1569 domain-containing protein [Thalassotalea euphylliae]
MNRRQFLVGAVAGAASMGIGSYALLATKVDKSQLTIDAALQQIAVLKESHIKVTGTWSWPQILNHCAQSIELSMHGYPAHKSALFKQSVGRLAFSVFSQRGEMVHNLSEPIPGAGLLLKDADLNQAYQRIETALHIFKHYPGALAEHFAYGKLSKAEYEQAHVMHIYNHMSTIV